MDGELVVAYVTACRDADHPPVHAIVSTLSALGVGDQRRDKEIALVDAGLSPSDVAALAHALRLCAPTTLDLSGNTLDADAARDVVGALATLRAIAPGHARRRVKRLALARNAAVGDGGAGAVASCLLLNVACAATLERLDLRGCGIGDAGCACVADALAKDLGLSSRRLDVLLLDDNVIGDVGAAAIARALSGESRGATTVPLALVELGLCGNSITDEGAMVLAAALASGRAGALQSVAVGQNAFGARGVDALLAAVLAEGTGRNVRKLEASGAPLTLLGAGLIAAALQRAHSRYGGGATRVVDLCVGDAVSEAARAVVTEGIARASAAAVGGARLHVAISRLRIGLQVEVIAYPYRRDDGSAVRMYEAPKTPRARADAPGPPAVKATPQLERLTEQIGSSDARSERARSGSGGGARGGGGIARGAAGGGRSDATDPTVLDASSAGGGNGAIVVALRSLLAKVSVLESVVESLQLERNAERQHSGALELRVQVSHLLSSSLSLSVHVRAALHVCLARAALSLARVPVLSRNRN